MTRKCRQVQPIDGADTHLRLGLEEAEVSETVVPIHPEDIGHAVTCRRACSKRRVDRAASRPAADELLLYDDDSGRLTMVFGGLKPAAIDEGFCLGSGTRARWNQLGLGPFLGFLSPGSTTPV